ncbi:hypothetical protein DDV21_005280 [Streptococcus chenjunshii]|uniref:Polymerase n=1 Tax=Streptococcus chenjunshii TaxID=2173853 RepID=A0A372KQE6_9STRE|nr:hypothetical protein [Streptococcus chenjunshii]AXQ78534.1 hypothetical protein DDV21_005280 [Streptococcus chenjunshii]RFU52004.1 hypothetical protein DDV22_00765 [Streptococcus chenjunshii]RFU54196.1 hypothetical protein DDV23_01320 [Streptococcus chenjunshii]
MIETQTRLGVLKTHELLFFMSLIPYLVIEMFGTTMFSIPYFLHTIAKAVLIFAIISVFFKKTWSVYFLLVAALFSITGVLVWHATSDTGVLVLAIFLMGAYKIDVRKIITVYLIIIGSIMLLTFISSLLGLIPNLQYIRPDTGIVRNSFGIIYPTDFAAHVFYLYLFSAYLFLWKRPWLLAGVGLFTAWFLIRFSDARLDALTVLITGFIFVLIYYLPKNRLYHKLMSWSALATVAAAYLSYYLTVHFNPRQPFYAKVNAQLSGRLSLGKRALDLYGIKPFGQVIEFIGNGGSTDSVSNYNFVDSSFLKVMLLYGAVFIILFIILTTIRSIQSVNSKDYYTLAVLLAVAVNSMVAHHLIEPYYNVFSILLLADFTKNWHQTKRRKNF